MKDKASAMNALRLALDAGVAAECEYNARRLVVWRELKVADPVLTGEILRLGFNESAAAQWVCRSFQELGDSLAALVVAGRGTEIMNKVHRTMHGSVG
jgi:hypothetical protein